MKTSYIVFFLILLSNTNTFSQNKINGKINNSEGVPIPYANVLLHSLKHEKTINGVVSNDTGQYIFESVVEGEYKIEVSVIGYKTIESETFLIREGDIKKIDFLMKEETQALDEVVVKGQRPIIKQIGGKLVVDIENSEIVSSNLQDVMKKVPGIIVTNGNLSYAGKQGVTILINGKTTRYMDISTLLKNLPADNIAKVELIQQPGAEFDAQGTGPFINIILKKNVAFGTHGNIKINTGYDNKPEYGTSFIISSYKNKLNWQLGTGYKKNAWREDLFIKRHINNQVYDQSNISPFNPVNFNLNGNLDYYINEKHTIGISARRNQSNSDRVTSNLTGVTENNAAEELMTNNDIDKKWLIVNINPYYEFNDEKNKILLDFNYVNYKSENISTLYKVGESKINYTNQRYNQDGNYQILTYKGDYKRTLNSKFNLSTGIKYSAVDTDSDLNTFTQDSKGNYNFNEIQSDRFLVNENIFAFYTKIDFSHEDWNISGGLRWEESNTKGISESTGQTRSRKISKLFPSISVNRSINDKLGAGLSYSYRINRPPYSSLNSFVYYYDPYTYEEGNPNLSSAFTNSFQFNLTYNEQPFFSVGYDVTDDALFELVRQNDSTARTSRTEVNIKNYKNLNFQIFAPLNFTKKMNGYSGFIINMSSYDEPRLAPRLDLSKWSLTWFTNLEYQLPWGINSEISGYYSTGGLQGMIEYEWLAGLSFAVSKTFFSDQLKTNIGIGELLNRKFNGNIKYDNINANIVSDWSRYNVYMQMTYSFGSDYNRKKQRENSSEDEQNRIEKNN